MSFHVLPHHIDLFHVSVKMIQEEEIPKPKAPETIKTLHGNMLLAAAAVLGRKKPEPRYAVLEMVGTDWKRQSW